MIAHACFIFIIDACEQPIEPGPCEAYNPSFGYNPKSARCEEFIYGGCSGNENRFGTMEACMQRCNPG